MTNDEYNLIQKDLGALINNEHQMRFKGSSKHWKIHEEAVLKCKSAISNYKPSEEFAPVVLVRDIDNAPTIEIPKLVPASMTKEEALSKIKGYLTDLLPSEEYGEVEEIIKALKQTDTLDEIRAEIEEKYGHCDICEYFEDYDYEDNNISEYRYVANVKDILQIIDKYKADKKDCTTCIGFGDKDYAQSFCHDCVKDIQNHYKAKSEE